MKTMLGSFATLLLLLSLGACTMNFSTAPRASAVSATTTADHSLERLHVFSAGGNIRESVEAFRTELGALNPNVPGSQAGGRREINWDAVPAAQTNTNTFPDDFFNQPVTGRARGAVFTTPGTGFRVSDNNFADLNPDFANQFVFFSPIRTFAAVGSNVTNVDFFVPGSNTAAVSRGFGVVFSDVDRLGSASIRLFDAAGTNLGRFLAPVAPSGVSFIAVAFPSPIVARVEIISGQGAVQAGAIDVSDRDKGPADDLVIMDDFIYGEPMAIGTQAESQARALASGGVAH